MRAWAVIGAGLMLAAPARAERLLSASLRTGVAIYPSSAVAAGPNLGLELSAGLWPQLALVVGASASRHGIAADRGGGTLEVAEAGAGLSYLVDVAPLLPYVHAGVMAAYRDTGRAHAFGPWPYLGLELVLPLRPPFTVALDARYAVQVESGLAQFGYAQLGLDLGLMGGLSRP